MTIVKNGRLFFNEVPSGTSIFLLYRRRFLSSASGYPEPGKTTVYDDSGTIDIDTIELNGGFLVKVVALSIDPYLRGRMRNPEEAGYVVSTIFTS